jgi:uncharacterized membrane protein
MTGDVLQRIEAAERRVSELQHELAELRRLVVEPESVVWLPEAEPAPEPAPGEPEPLDWSDLPPAPTRPAVFELPRPSFRLPQISGAHALAWTGGAVTVLGIVFFFVLAVNRGWIGPGTRVGLGAAAAVLVFAAGVFARRRYGETQAALAAVGAGIAGGYATTLAAAVHYDLFPDWTALVVAIVIAGLALATSLLWPSEILAGVGLVGAAVVPALLAIDVGMTRLGAGFVELIFAVAAVVAVLRRWPALLVATAVAALPQVGVLVAQAGPGTDWSVVAIAAVFGALVLGAGLAMQITSPVDGANYAGLAFVLGAAVCALFAAPALFESVTTRGFAYLAVGLVYAALAAFFRRRQGRFDRDLSSILAAIALTVGAVSVGDLLSGQTLAMTWAGEAAVLGWMAYRLKESRYYVGSLAYLALAIVHALAFDARPRTLFGEVAHPAHGAPSLLLVAGAAAVLTVLLRQSADERFERELGVSPHDLSIGVAAVGAGFAVYAASLGILALPESFAWGHTAIDALWSLLGLAFLVLGLRRRSLPLQVGGFALVVAAAAKAVGFEADALGSDAWAYSFLIVGGAAVLAGFLPQPLAGKRGLQPAAPAGLALSAALWIVADVVLVPHGWLGASLLAAAAVYGAFAAVAFPSARLRDLSTLHWATALAIAAPAAALLLSDTLLVLAWTATAAALSLLAKWTREDRFHAGALVYLLAGLAHTVVLDASPDHFFFSSRHPASGLGALALVIAAAAVFAACIPADLLRRARVVALSSVGVLAVYGASLAILELFEAIGSASVHTSFQRGHTAVSTLWGLLGLVLLYLGLKRHTALRVAGFVLFGASLAKLFLYDLAFLSSVARALSFLAVGAVLLLGGFFYQRLSAEVQDKPVALP